MVTWMRPETKGLVAQRESQDGPNTAFSASGGIDKIPNQTALALLQAAEGSIYHPLVSQLGKATRGFVHDAGSLRCLGRFGRASAHPLLPHKPHKPLVRGWSPFRKSSMCRRRAVMLMLLPRRRQFGLDLWT